MAERNSRRDFLKRLVAAPAILGAISRGEKVLLASPTEESAKREFQHLTYSVGFRISPELLNDSPQLEKMIRLRRDYHK